MKEILKEALEFLKAKDVEYADARYEEHQREEIEVESAHLKSFSYSQDKGVGIRVLFDGGWGFAATDTLSKNSVMKAAELALEIAKESARTAKEKVRLAEEPSHVDTFKSPAQVDPFSISKAEKIELLKEATSVMMKNEKVKRAVGTMDFRKIHKVFVNTEGSDIEQDITISGAGIVAFAVSEEGFQVRSYPSSFGGDYATRGWEFVQEMKLIENAEKVAGEAAALLSAPEIEPGEYDIIIDGQQMSLQVHESCGHPTELDRVFGSEISFAGGSFLQPELLNKLKYGSDIVNITADATLEGGLGSFGYDDEGVKARMSYLVKDGLFVGYLMDRQTAAKLGLRSNGAARADSWSNMPIIRMTNINLLPGDKTLDELISEIDYGFLLATNKSWSIDDMRVNFQFATEIAYEIKGGKLTGKIFKNPVYYGKTTEFWNSCDGIANKDFWHIWGVPNCGKGQPGQVMWVGHGTSPARFRKVKVGVAR
ncbi:MAG: TldD/PmbA family protein [Thermotogaceae bacterium]|nr:TldD/PmbA family protein [Thermotogaceae bacterium]